MIKKKLTEALRYNQVTGILKYIISEDLAYSIPVDAYIDSSGKTSWRVDGRVVTKEAKLLLQTIEDDVDEESVFPGSFESLEQYVHSHTNMLLHNYAVTISHRTVPNDMDMEVIRSWLILDNLLICFGSKDWSIPDGWKYKNEEDESPPFQEVNNVIDIDDQDVLFKKLATKLCKRCAGKLAIKLVRGIDF